MPYKGIKKFLEEFRESVDFTKRAKSRLKENGVRATKQALEEEIIILKKEWDTSTERGIKLHKEILDKKTKIKQYIVEGRESAHDYKNNPPDPSTNILKNNTSYLEKFIVSEKYKLLGYADEVEVKKNFVNVEDTKTTKKIYRSSAYRLKNGFLLPPTYYFSPIENIQTCNFYDAALQMSLYLYILLTYNKKLKPGKLHIRHIKTNDKDEILEENLVEVPYLLEEVKKLLKYRLKNGC